MIQDLFRLQGIVKATATGVFEDLKLKFWKARTEITVALSLPCWLSQLAESANRADSGHLQFRSEPSVLNVRSSSTPETVAFIIP